MTPKYGPKNIALKHVWPFYRTRASTRPKLGRFLRPKDNLLLRSMSSGCHDIIIKITGLPKGGALGATVNASATFFCPGPKEPRPDLYFEVGVTK